MRGKAIIVGAIRNFLDTSYSTGKTVKRDFESNELIKKEQSGELREYATQKNSGSKKLPKVEPIFFKQILSRLSTVLREAEKLME